MCFTGTHTIFGIQNVKKEVVYISFIFWNITKCRKYSLNICVSVVCVGRGGGEGIVHVRKYNMFKYKNAPKNIINVKTL